MRKYLHKILIAAGKAEINLDSKTARNGIIDEIIEVVEEYDKEEDYWTTRPEKKGVDYSKIACPDDMVIDDEGRIWRMTKGVHPD
tara:strand:+ start:969 stop:1223 length:255 start_codon:yes stop_codon:yes gene_type:complete